MRPETVGEVEEEEGAPGIEKAAADVLCAFGVWRGIAIEVVTKFSLTVAAARLAVSDAKRSGTRAGALAQFLRDRAFVDELKRRADPQTATHAVRVSAAIGEYDQAQAERAAASALRLANSRRIAALPDAERSELREVALRRLPAAMHGSRSEVERAMVKLLDDAAAAPDAECRVAVAAGA